MTLGNFWRNRQTEKLAGQTFRNRQLDPGARKQRMFMDANRIVDAGVDPMRVQQSSTHAIASLQGNCILMVDRAVVHGR